MGTKMFQFPTFAFCLKQNDTASLCRVPPFGHLGIDGYLHLPQAFRSLSRPSSPPRAKASTVRSFLLFYFFARFVFTTSFLFLQTCQRSSLGFPALLSSLFPPFSSQCNHFVIPQPLMAQDILSFLFSFSSLLLSFLYLLFSLSEILHLFLLLLPKLARFNAFFFFSSRSVRRFMKRLYLNFILVSCTSYLVFELAPQNSLLSKLFTLHSKLST